MAKPLLTDELWLRIEPLLPAPKPRPQGGRPLVPNRAALVGILFVLRTGCPWEYLPQEMGCGSGMTCWRRLRDWHAAGIWRQIWLALLDELGLADEIDWDKVVLVDGSRLDPHAAILATGFVRGFESLVGRLGVLVTSSPSV